jgi:hypothetical protein
MRSVKGKKMKQLRRLWKYLKKNHRKDTDRGGEEL